MLKGFRNTNPKASMSAPAPPPSLNTTPHSIRFRLLHGESALPIQQRRHHCSLKHQPPYPAPSPFHSPTALLMYRICITHLEASTLPRPPPHPGTPHFFHSQITYSSSACSTPFLTICTCASLSRPLEFTSCCACVKLRAHVCLHTSET